MNSLNELASVVRTNNSLTVAGTTTSGATNVTVADNGNAAVAATRYGDATFARTNVTLLNGTNTFTAAGLDGLGRGDCNTVVAYLPTAVTLAYDLNGNLRTNGTRIFQYDDENQIICITESGAWMSTNVYDGKMRRRIVREYGWTAGAWVQTAEVRYVYDGNVVIQERNAFNVALKTYTRGRDLSGSLEGAGGIGGLLALTQTSAGGPQHVYYHADGNGNVTTLVDGLQKVAARYLYDPFGNTLSASGPLADVNLYRFSSKEIHPTSGLVCYLYRFYDPNLQRWPNRDPIEEAGGNNLYSFVRNNPINSVDPLGLITPEQLEELKKEIELIQKMRDLANQMIDNFKNCKPQCLGASSVVAHYCNCYRDFGKDCNDFATCICIQLVDEAACRKRALKACEIAKTIIDAYKKTKGKGD